MEGLAAYLINEINQTEEETEIEYANANDETRKLIDERDEEAERLLASGRK